MEIKTEQKYNNKTVTKTRTVSHEFNTMEIAVLTKIDNSKYGYKLSSDELIDPNLGKVICNLGEFDLIEEDVDAFSATYFITEEGKKFLQGMI